MTDLRQDLQEYLQGYQWREFDALPGRTNHLRCGILLPLRFDATLLCYAGKRSLALNNHPGEICFPGGQPEERDADLSATALREAHEEMNAHDVTLIGRLSSFPLYTSDFRLEPFVGVVNNDDLLADGRELIELCPIDIHEMLARPRINCIPFESDWNAPDGIHLSPVFEVGDHLMFGATAYVFYELLEVVAHVMGVSVPEKTSGPYQWSDILPNHPPYEGK